MSLSPFTNFKSSNCSTQVLSCSVNNVRTTPVWIPAPAVLQAQLLFVHPVERAVDRGARAVVRQLGELSAREIFDVDVVLAVAYPPHSAAVGREFRKHQGRFRAIAAEFLEG